MHMHRTMFDRYDEAAMRALFFARSSLTEHGGTCIDPEHLLIGLLAAHPQAVLAFASAPADLEDLRERLIAMIAGETRLPETEEVAMSSESLAAIEHAQIEADDLSSARIRPEHLILGILAKTAGPAAAAVRRVGVDPSAVRRALASERPAGGGG